MVTKFNIALTSFNLRKMDPSYVFYIVQILYKEKFVSLMTMADDATINKIKKLYFLYFLFYMFYIKSKYTLIIPILVITEMTPKVWQR